jgi:hypothetical protein
MLKELSLSLEQSDVSQASAVPPRSLDDLAVEWLNEIRDQQLTEEYPRKQYFTAEGLAGCFDQELRKTFHFLRNFALEESSKALSFDEVKADTSFFYLKKKADRLITMPKS